MKNSILTILAAVMLCAALLTGCGDARDARANQEPTATGRLEEAVDDLLPDLPTPDPRDGIVDDNDGTITEREPDGITNDMDTGAAGTGGSNAGGTNTNAGTVNGAGAGAGTGTGTGAGAGTGIGAGTGTGAGIGGNG